MGKATDYTGRRFGFLTAITPTHRILSSGRRMPAWSLRCDCGVEVVAMTVNLTKGKHQSCGCKRAELVARHYPGDGKKPEYRVYRQMLDRCYLETATNFKWYGGKGVTVCDRWRRGTNQLTGFQAFMADMGPRPEGLTLERNDPFGAYEPGNCRWATWAEQHQNRREHHLTPIEREILRQERSEANRGELASGAKLTTSEVIKIKSLIRQGVKTSDLAASFSIAPQTISNIKAGRRWPHVPWAV